MKHKIIYQQILPILLSICLFAFSAVAQTTAFNYQGKLSDGGNAANATFQMEFKLFDALSDGNQIVPTITNSSVSVTQGVFSVELDFGANAFTGADRFLEIAVRRDSGDPFTVLNPRQKVLSAPFAIKSRSSDTAITAANAVQLDGLSSSRFVQLDANGDVSIGTTSTGSKLTVAGVIESTTGGIKFPDATTQTTAGLITVTTNTTLTGNGTAIQPLGIASPLLVRDMDHPAFQPFQASTSVTGVFATVPAGKILVIEYVAGYQQITTPSGAGLELVNASTNNYYYIAPQVISSTGTSYWHNYSQQTRIYLTAGQQLRVNWFVPSFSHYVTVSGFYVNAP
jgi:hypothetical protein